MYTRVYCSKGYRHPRNPCAVVKIPRTVLNAGRWTKTIGPDPAPNLRGRGTRNNNTYGPGEKNNRVGAQRLVNDDDNNNNHRYKCTMNPTRRVHYINIPPMGGNFTFIFFFHSWSPFNIITIIGRRGMVSNRNDFFFFFLFARRVIINCVPYTPNRANPLVSAQEVLPTHARYVCI